MQDEEEEDLAEMRDNWAVFCLFLHQLQIVNLRQQRFQSKGWSQLVSGTHSKKQLRLAKRVDDELGMECPTKLYWLGSVMI